MENIEYIEPQRHDDTEQHGGLLNTNTEFRENCKRLNTVNRKGHKVWHKVAQRKFIQNTNTRTQRTASGLIQANFFLY